VTAPVITDDQLAALHVVATDGNRTKDYDPGMRYGSRAARVARTCGWQSMSGPSWSRHKRTATRAAVNRLLVLREQDLVTDVDGRWLTTDDGERLAEWLWPEELAAVRADNDKREDAYWSRGREPLHGDNLPVPDEHQRGEAPMAGDRW
jgi:hypothetical protein